ncbi:uncharacterized protein, partial [Haliotis cracherodii]|uniref:uncharacterized protein n=1 Tax=Haliotis cracherodii TaxID=6455 RepID=UPI0039EC6688
MFLPLIYVLCCVAQALSVLSQLVYNKDSCTNVTFHRRSEMDDLVFAGSLIEEINQVDMRAECFSQCQWQRLCNLVLYNPLTRTCRLYSGVFASNNEGLSRIGWQYYGVSCDGYRLANARPGVDIINTAVEDVCQDTFNVVTANETSSCLRDASWESVRIKCTSCYHGQVMLSLLPTLDHTEHLPFDLGDGMTFRMTASGDNSEYNEVQFEMTNSDLPLLLSLRWTWGDTSRLVFN